MKSTAGGASALDLAGGCARLRQRDLCDWIFVPGSNSKLSKQRLAVCPDSGHRTVMTISNNYSGPPENLSRMVVPVPVVLHKEERQDAAADVFDHIDSLSAPRLVENWEQDPCRPRINFEMAPGAGGLGEEEGAARQDATASCA